jgi:hypothetical protein
LCNKASIQQYEAMSRQPQTGQMQDWITARKRPARDRQFHLPCQAGRTRPGRLPPV